MFFSCLAVLINTVTDWNIWWVEEKLEVTMFIWKCFTSFITFGCIVTSIVTLIEYCDRNMSRSQHLSNAVQMDAAITALHDGVQCLLSFVILALYTYYYYYSCTKPILVADENGSDGLETVRAIFISSTASFIMTAYRFIRKLQYNNDNTCFYGLIITCNVIIIIFAFLLWYVGVC